MSVREYFPELTEDQIVEIDSIIDDLYDRVPDIDWEFMTIKAMSKDPDKISRGLKI